MASAAALPNSHCWDRRVIFTVPQKIFYQEADLGEEITFSISHCWDRRRVIGLSCGSASVCTLATNMLFHPLPALAFSEEKKLSTNTVEK